MEKGEMTVAIIGVGYVGLPLAMCLVKAGYKVTGIDYNKAWVEALNQGESNIIDVSSKKLKSAIKAKLFEAVTDYSVLEHVNYIMICVPTPLDESKVPNLEYINKAVAGMMPFLKKGVLISLESTTYPGTTEELIVKPIQKQKGWKVGQDFFVCYSPERVDPGNKKYHTFNTPKVIGGYTMKCLENGSAFYKSFLKEVIEVSSTQVAEMSKLLENTFRCINIALMNEMTMLCERMNIDIWEVIKGASTKPFGFMPFYPGPGVGGHCIPLDPLYLETQAKKYNYFSRFIEAAADINNNMPYYVVRQIERILAAREKFLKGSKILLMGMSYKKDMGDIRESPSLAVYKLLKQAKSDIDFYDPYIKKVQEGTDEIDCIELEEESIKAYDLIVILTDHSEVDYNWILRHGSTIYDTRNVFKEVKSEKVIRLGTNIQS